MPLYEGEDGKLYFNFAVGLKVQLREDFPGRESKEYVIEVVGCRYIGNTEYYDITRDGVPLPQPQSANRIKYLISRFGIKTLAFGERKEMPLLLDDVKLYYDYFARCKEIAQRKLESVPGYSLIQTELNRLNIRLAFAEAREQKKEATALQKEIDDLNARKLKIMNSCGIDQSDLKGIECEFCKGKGYIGYQICDCALKRVELIKGFCADNRRHLNRLTSKK